MTHRSPRVLVGLASALVLAAAACSSDSSTSPTTQTFDLASAFASLDIPGVGAMLAAGGAGSLSGTAIPAISPAACTWSASSQSFGCPSVTVNGFTITRSFSLHDAAGNAEQLPIKGTTDAVTVVTNMTGPVTMGVSTGTASGTMTSQQSVTVSGLVAGNPVVNGTGTVTGNGTMTVSGIPVPVVMAASNQVNSVVLPPLGSTTKVPRSGTVTSAIQTTIGSIGTSEHLLLTFNGTNTATLVITTPLTTVTCQVDLTSTGSPSCSP